ncbi:hypothetical protein ACFLTH_12195 [Bacteroidota bacterium]
MKTTMIIFLMIFGLNLFAQVRTDESKVTINETTGDTLYTKSVTIADIEDITPRNNMLIINPLKFFLFYNLSYFGKISDDLAVGGGLQVPTIAGMEGVGFNAELRYYPSGRELRGFYIAPNISYNNLTVDGETVAPFSIGMLVGWQWFLGDQFAMGLGIGVDYYTGSARDDDGDFHRFSGKVPALRFDIGYAW